MTPNEARTVLRDYCNSPQARRRDVLGRVARDDMRQAYTVLALHSLEVSNRSRHPRIKQAQLETAAYYRQAAMELEP